MPFDRLFYKGVGSPATTDVVLCVRKSVVALPLPTVPPHLRGGGGVWGVIINGFLQVGVNVFSRCGGLVPSPLLCFFSEKIFSLPLPLSALLSAPLLCFSIKSNIVN